MLRPSLSPDLPEEERSGREKIKENVDYE